MKERLSVQDNLRSPERNDAHRIGIATATRYPAWEPLSEGLKRDPKDTDGLRGDLALKMFASAKEQGFQLGIIDGGSSDAFRAAVVEVTGKAPSEEKKPGMSSGRRQAFGEVSAMDGVTIVAWTEPEKIAIPDTLIEAATPILEGTADVVVPHRGEAGFATYPVYQVSWEKAGNKAFNKALKEKGLLPEDADELDVWGGTRLMKNDPAVINLFTHPWELHLKINPSEVDRNDPMFNADDPQWDEKKMNPELWPNALFLPVVGMLWRDRIVGRAPRVVSVPIDYHHPQEQTESELEDETFKAKRRQQYENIITATDDLLYILDYDAKHEQLYTAGLRNKK